MSNRNWTYRKSAQSDEDIAQIATMRRNGININPTLLLTNEGQAIVMEGDKRIACVDMHADYKRGERHKTECSEREASARLIAAAPDLFAALESLLKVCDEELDPKRTPEMREARIAITKARGEE